MTLRQIADKIPAEYRREILETNMISKAIPINSDPSMHYLGTVWKNYIAEENLDCGACLTRVLDNYRQLQDIFIGMEKETELLNGI